MNINNYDEFISESLILESNICYSDQFIEILKNTDDYISKELLGLSYNDIDVPFNFFDANYKKNDTVLFYPDSKVSKKIMTNGYSIYLSSGGFTQLMNLYLSKKGFETSRFERIFPGVEIEIVEKIPKDIIEKIFNKNDIGFFLVKRLDRDKFGICTIDGISFDIDYNNIKPSEMKVGRLVNTILKKAGIKVSDKDVEQFVNKWKSFIDFSNNKYSNFKLVKGEDIRYWYYEEKYEGYGGSLNGSCMKHKNCQPFFDLYVENPDVCQLLILKSHNEDTILGRALVWKLRDGDTFMDRIYTSNDSDVELFKKYAQEKGWMYKSCQDFNEYTSIVLPNGGVKHLTLNVDLKNSYFDSYPYMDTLKFLNYNKNTLTNNTHGHYTNRLEDTNGGVCEVCNGGGRTDCPDCGGTGDFTCTDCNGSGELSCGYCDGKGVDKEGNECEECKGRGEENCNNCNNGYIECEMCHGNCTVDCPECS